MPYHENEVGSQYFLERQVKKYLQHIRHIVFLDFKIIIIPKCWPKYERQRKHRDETRKKKSYPYPKYIFPNVNIRRAGKNKPAL